MSLKAELIAAKAQSFNSRKWSDVVDCLQDLLEQHGDVNGNWAVVRTAFHGGGLISTHKTATAAILKARSMRSECACGCSVIERADAVDSLPYAADCRSPYAGAR